MKCSWDKVLPFIIIFFLALSVLACVIKQKYEISVALAGIFSSIFIPFFTKNLEIEKHQKQIIISNKINSYKKLYEYMNSIIKYPFAFYEEDDWNNLNNNRKSEEYKNLNCEDTDYRYIRYNSILLNAIFEYQKDKVDELLDTIKTEGIFIDTKILNEINNIIELIRRNRQYISKNQHENIEYEKKIRTLIDLIKSELRKNLTGEI